MSELPATTVVAPEPASRTRRVLLEVGAGTALGFIAASFGGPVAIGWWYEPPSRDAFSCAGTVRAALAQFVWMQFGCALVGAVALSLGSLLIRRRLRKRRLSAGSSPLAS